MQYLTPEQQIPRRVRQILTMKHGIEGQGLDSGHLLRTMEARRLYRFRRRTPKGFGRELTKAATMQQGGASAEARVGTFTLNVQNFFLHSTRADALCGTTCGY